MLSTAPVSPYTVVADQCMFLFIRKENSQRSARKLWHSDNNKKNILFI